LVVGRGLDEIAAWADGAGVALPLVSWHGDDVPVDATASRYDLVVVDDYFINAAWLRAVSERMPTFVIDDWMRRELRVAGLVNPNVGAARADYPDGVAGRWLLGPEYTLLQRDVLEAPRAPLTLGRAREVMITFGGSDPDNRTDEVAAALSTLRWHQEGGALTVMLGPSYAGDESWWSRWAAARPDRRKVVVATRDDYVRRLAIADLVICGAGTTTYELAFLGRPFVPIALVENQTRVANEWHRYGVGRGWSVRQPDWLGRVAREVERLLEDGDERARIANAANGLVDGGGSQRVLAACRETVRGGSTTG